MNSKKLAIVIPYAGEQEYIDEMMNSVLANNAISEVLIGVDLSRTDEKSSFETWDKWIQAAGKLNMRLEIFFSKSPGPAAVRNLAISKSDSEFILPVDADDKISSRYVELVLNAFNFGDPNMGIVYGKAELFGESSGEWSLPKFSKESIVLENCIFATSGFRKEDWELVGGYDEELIYGQEDWDFWLKILGLGRTVHFIDETVFFYRIRSNSRSTAFRGMWEQVIWTYDRVCKNNHKLMASQIESIYHRRIQLELENSTFKHASKGFLVALWRKYPILVKFTNKKMIDFFRKKLA